MRMHNHSRLTIADDAEVNSANNRITIGDSQLLYNETELSRHQSVSAN